LLITWVTWQHFNILFDGGREDGSKEKEQTIQKGQEGEETQASSSKETKGSKEKEGR
jgi:hypothetical protein